MTQSLIPYYPWNSRGDPRAAVWESCSPNLKQWEIYDITHFGGRALGCHNNRFIAGTFKWSDHAWGAADDRLYPNRAVTVQVCNFLVDWSKEIGVNAIHDYEVQRMWKPIVGWRFTHAIGSLGGKWLHIETNFPMYGNGTPIAARINVAPPGPPPPPPKFLPEFGVYGLYPLNKAKRTIKPFSYGDDVKYLHGVLHWQAAQPIRWPDWASYDGATVAPVDNVQHLGQFKYPSKALDIERITQVCGPATWGLIDRLAVGTF